jgi:hypothetical protein
MHNVFGRIVDGFLSGVGFVFAMITVPLVIIHPILAAIPITLLGAWFSRHRISAFQQGVDAYKRAKAERDAARKRNDASPYRSPRNRHTVTPYSWGHAAP